MKFVFLVVLVILGFAGKLIVDAGAFRKIEPHYEGRCAAIEGIPGAEDIEPLGKAGDVLISSDHRPEHEGQVTANGHLLLWNPEQAATPPKPVSPELGFDFHPHGLAVLGTRVWVVNHRREETTIEVFDWAEGNLAHRESLRHPLLVNANDIAAVSETQFYVTSDHAGKTALLRTLEDYSRFGRGYVSFYDGKNFSVKAKGVRFANGLQLSPDGKSLVVASMLGRELLVFDRKASNDLTVREEISLGTSPDNISFDDKGDLWVGAHPNLFELKAHSQNHEHKAPAQILRVRAPLTIAPLVEEIFVDNGSRISASSVALSIRGHLLLGSIFDTKMLDCQPNPPSTP